MAETGGPILEGMGRPEEPRVKGVVEGMKENWKEKTEEEIKKRAKFKAKQAEWKMIGPTVEAKHVAMFDRITNAMNEGKLKRVAEKLRPVVKLEAKGIRLGTAVVDTVISTIPLVAGSLIFGRGISAIAQDADITSRIKWRVSGVLKVLAIGSAGMTLGTGISWLAPARRTSMFLSDIGGAVGERVVQITNKIFGGKTKAEIASA